MLDVLHDPIVVASLVSALVALITPYVAAKIRSSSKERLAEIASEQSEADRFYKDLQEELHHSRRENEKLDARVLVLERQLTRFVSMEADITRIRSLLEAESPEITTAIALLVQLLDRIRYRGVDAVKEIG